MERGTHGRAWPFAVISAVMLTCLTVAAQLSAKDGSVQAIVQRLNTTLLDVMQSADALGYEGRYEKLDDALRQTFDFAFMARIAAGRAWNGMDEGQRDELVERFSRMSVATFAARFNGYGGERFEIVGEKPGPRDTVIVDDRIVRPAGEPIGLNFVLREQTGVEASPQWRIIDVMLDGKYSELARQRAEFASVLKEGGFGNLIGALDDRIAALATGS